MFKNGSKWVLLFAVLFGLLGGGYFLYNKNKNPVSEKELDSESGGFTSPLAQKQEMSDVFSLLSGKGKDKEEKSKDINILLMGIDRRTREEAYRTDIMILATLNPVDNKIVLASVPRDLWWDGERLNAVFLNNGWPEMQNAFQKVTGIKPNHYIVTDFEDFKWVVDQMGGVTVNVETTFTDNTYPIDETHGIQTVTFTQGPEKMTGERALIFSRSRKGDFDNGDWGRMRRQHLLLKGMLDAVIQEGSVFNPMVVEKVFQMVTTNRMDTNLTVDDAKFLWDFHKERDKYTIESILMDYEYLITPPTADYGGAWVLVAEGEDYSKFTKDLDVLIHPQNAVPEETMPVDSMENVETPVQ